MKWYTVVIPNCHRETSSALMKAPPIKFGALLRD
jgi:hypothetical protein